MAGIQGYWQIIKKTVMGLFMSFKNANLRGACLSVVFGTLAIGYPVNALYAQQDEFSTVVSKIYSEARAKGVSEATLNRALGQIEPVDGIKRLENYQPERVQSFVEYYGKFVTSARTQRGVQELERHRDLLDRAGSQCGLPPQYILSIWARESEYGDILKPQAQARLYHIIPALVTLARDGRNEKRRDYFKGEAIEALKMVDRGYEEVLTAKGSWAGAMGHTQFMPSSFRNFAVDGDGDGRKDIWNNMSDVFASTANYLCRNNWKAGERWGREVKLPRGFSESLLTDKLAAQTIKTPSQWAALGVTLPGGGRLPGDNTMRGRIIAPDGLSGPTYIVYDNFITLMRYNSSYKYALSVAGLADAIATAAARRSPQLNR